MIAWRLFSSSSWIRSSAIASPSSLRRRLISQVNSRVRGSRSSQSAIGRKKGSTRRSTWTRKMPARLIALRMKLPVSGGGSP
jgi:hypothetical protein